MSQQKGGYAIYIYNKNLWLCLSFSSYNQAKFPYILTKQSILIPLSMVKFRSKLKSNCILKHFVQAHRAQHSVKYNLCVACTTERSHCDWSIWNRYCTRLTHNTKQTLHKTGTSSRKRTKQNSEEDYNLHQQVLKSRHFKCEVRKEHRNIILIIVVTSQ